MSAIEVLKKYRNDTYFLDEWTYDSAEEFTVALDEALLALEQKENGLKCIGCGSIPKLKLCCNSCYQKLKLKEKRQVELIEWLEKEIRKCYPKNFCFKDWTPIMDTVQKQVRHDTLKEVLERVGEQK